MKMRTREPKPILIKRRTAWLIITALCAVSAYLATLLIRQIPF